MIYETDPLIYETVSMIYQTVRLIYETVPLIYETLPMIYQTVHIIYETVPRIHEVVTVPGDHKPDAKSNNVATRIVSLFLPSIFPGSTRIFLALLTGLYEEGEINQKINLEPYLTQACRPDKWGLDLIIRAQASIPLREGDQGVHGLTKHNSVKVKKYR